MSVGLQLSCRLCRIFGQATEVRGADSRRYYLCGNCSLIFADPEHHRSAADEKSSYLNHKNSIEDSGYVDFLNRVVQPMLFHLQHGMRGLDYGCGPGPTLSLLLRRRGFDCDNYDPFFADGPFRPPYDFVFSTECFEHFHNPRIELQRISSMLNPGGLLGIMTERWATLEQFANWYYTRDPTHVCFYHTNTFNYICERYGFSLVWMDENRVAILRRKAHASTRPPPLVGR